MAESWADLGAVAPPPTANSTQHEADDWSDLGSAVSEGSSPLAKTMPVIPPANNEKMQEPAAKPAGDPDSWLQVGWKIIRNLPSEAGREIGGALQSLGETPPEPNMPAGSMDWSRETTPETQQAYSADTPGTPANLGKRLFAAADADLKANAPNVEEGSAKSIVYDVASGLAEMAPAVLLSLRTENPTPTAAALIGLQAGSEKYGEARQSGRNVGQASLDAGFSATLNGAMAALPLGAIMKPGGKFLPKALASAGLGGVAGAATQAVQDGYDAGVLDRNMSWSDAVHGMKEAGIVGVITGALLGVGAHAIESREPVGHRPDDAVGAVMSADNVDDAIKSAQDAASAAPAYDIEDEARKAEAAAAETPVIDAGVDESAPEEAPVAPSATETPTETPAEAPPVTEDTVRQMMAGHFDNFAKILRGEAPEDVVPEEAPLTPVESAQEAQPAAEAQEGATTIPSQPETPAVAPEIVPQKAPEPTQEAAPEVGGSFARREGEPEPAPPFFSALTQAVESAKQEKAAPGQWLAQIKNTAGIKSEELQWSGVEDWLKGQAKSVTKPELLDYLRSHEVDVREVMHGEPWAPEKTAEFNRRYDEIIDLRDRGAQISHHEAELRLKALNAEFGPHERDFPSSEEIRTPTKFQIWTLPGGRRYRELLLTLPERNPEGTVPVGWRAGPYSPGTFVVFDNRGTLVRERVRAPDAASAIRDVARGESGFRSSHWDEPNVVVHVRFDDRTGPNDEKILRVAEVQSDWHQKGRKEGYEQEISPNPPGWATTGDATNRGKGVPNAPFKTSWHELAMKRMLRYAAENGYDRLSWDTGDTNAARYDLSKQIGRITYEKQGTSGFTPLEDIEAIRPSGGLLKAYDPTGNKVLDRFLDDDKSLPELIGKDAADKLVQQKPKLASSGGTALSRRELSGLDLKVGGEGMRGFYDKILPAFMNKYAKKWGAKVETSVISAGGGKSEPVHSVPITPAMRESVMQGQPMFARRAPKGEPTEVQHDTARLGFTPEFETQRALLAARLQSELGRRGLGRIAGRVADYILTPEGHLADGHYFDKIIHIALDTVEPMSMLSHEIIHALKDMDLFSKAEWRILVNEARRTWMKQYAGKLEGYAEHEKVEESIAFAAMDPKAQASTFAQRQFQRMRDFFEAVRNLFKGNGFDTADRILARTRTDAFGKRLAARETPKTEGSFGRRTEQDDSHPEDDAVSALVKTVVNPESGAAARQIAAAGLEQFKNVNAAESGEYIGSLFPRTLATLDDPSARFWNAWQTRDEQGRVNSEYLRRIISNTVIPLPQASRERVYGALELARKFNWRPPDDGRLIRVRNSSYWQARKTKAGDNYVLNAAETRAFHDLLRLGGEGWDRFTRALAKRENWTGPLDAAAIRQAANEQEEGFGKRRLNRLADAVEAASDIRNRPYFPAMRFGDYFIAVRPKTVTPGQRDTVWFETVEKPALADALGKGRTPAAELPAVKEAVARLRAMTQTNGSLAFPEATHSIEVGDLRSRPDILRNLNIPAIEKLFMLMERGVTESLITKTMGAPSEVAEAAYAHAAAAAKDVLLDAIYKDLQSGFKKQATLVPGYSADFDRSIGTHIGQIGRNAADVVHHDNIESAFQNILDNHPHPAVKAYWQHWRQYMENPATPFGRVTASMARYGAAWVMAANPSTTLFVASHTPMMAAPVLGVGGNMRRAAGELARALKETYAASIFDKAHGASIDVTKLGRDEKERALVAALDETGLTHSVGVDDLRALSSRQAALWGTAAPAMHRTMDIAMSNISVVDQANRNAIALAAYRMAKDGPILEKMLAPWLKHNALLREQVVREGLTPEAFAKFMLQEGAGVWGKSNQAVAMRGAEGNLLFALHGFQTRYLSTLWKLSLNMGPEGRIAAVWMMGALAASTGVLGLPLAKDGISAAEQIWKELTGEDPMIEAHVRSLFAGSEWGKIGAEMMLRGPLAWASGVDIGSRIGFGDIISRSATASDLMGTVPSIFAGALVRAYMREQTGQGAEAAAAELLPSAMRNPARGAVENAQGYESTSGTPVRTPEEIALPDVVKQALGLPPLANEQAYARDEYFQRLSQRDQVVRERTVRTAANMVMRAQRATAGGDGAKAESINTTLGSLLSDYNNAHWQAPILAPELKNAIFEATNPTLYRQLKTPKTVRGEAFSSPYP